MAQLDFAQPPSVLPFQETVPTDPASLPHLMRLEIVTDTRRIFGLAHHATAVRPVDMLNWTPEALALSDIEMWPLEGQARAAPRFPQAHISKQSIVFVVPQEVTPPGAAANRRPLEYIEKRRWRVSALVPRFIVTGYFHLPPAADPANASLFWNATFVPLTEAEAIYLPDPATTWNVPIIIVNSARVEAYCPLASLADE